MITNQLLYQLSYAGASQKRDPRPPFRAEHPTRAWSILAKIFCDLNTERHKPDEENNGSLEEDGISEPFISALQTGIGYWNTFHSL